MSLFKASAPGSLMLLGEYAVLHGHAALVCAVDKRITVKLTPRDDTQVELISTLGTYQTDITQLEITPPFRFVLAVLKKYQKRLKRGCWIVIESEFSDQVGLGSSAAVTVATLSAVAAWLSLTYSPIQLTRHARSIVQSVQGLGSGADVAACVLGGIVAYRMQPLFMKCISDSHPITVIYSGSKTPTVEAVTRVKNLFSAYPKLFKQLLQSIGDCAEQGIVAVNRKNWGELGKIMSIQQGLMHALGVNTPLLNSITEELKTNSSILGVKISGSGLGDCVVALGSLKDNYKSYYSNQGVQRLDVGIATEGVRCEKS